MDEVQQGGGNVLGVGATIVAGGEAGGDEDDEDDDTNKKKDFSLMDKEKEK